MRLRPLLLPRCDQLVLIYIANVALGPVAGPLGRVALGGRNWEGFAVDPYLSGVLTAKTVSGIQDAGVIASLKVRMQNPETRTSN